MIINLLPVATKIRDMDVLVGAAFLDDINGNVDNCTVSNVNGYLYNNIVSLNTQKIDTWKIYYDASRNCLRRSNGHINNLTTATNTTNLTTPPLDFSRQDFVSIAIACGKQREQTQKVDNELFQNLVNFSNQGYAINNFDKLKSNLKNTNNNFYVVAGANWVIYYLANHNTEFTNKTLSFEEETEIDDSGSRIADVVVSKAGQPSVYYEFKSVKDIKDSYIVQFVKDLKRTDVTDFGQIRWVFDHIKLSDSQVKIKFIAALNRNKALLDTIDLSKIRILLSNDFIIESNKSQSIINFFNIDFNFNSVFK